MRGHIRQRSKGSWTIIVDAGRDPATGKRKQRWCTIRGAKRDAERTLREMLTALEKGTYVQPNRLTLGEWLIQWQEGYVAMNTTPRTQESYRSIIHRHLIPALGTVQLHQLRPQHLLDYYAKSLAMGRVDRKGGLSARSVLYHHRILSEALGHAVKMDLLSRNVAKLVTPPRPARAKLAVLAADDVTRLLEAMSDSPYYVFYSTLLYTGLRRGELLALKWRNVDLDLACLRVEETGYKLGKGEYVIKEAKTPHSRRSVALSPSLALLLRRHRSDQEELLASLGARLSEEAFVFARPDGKPLDPSHVTRTFAKLVRQAGLPHIRLHDLRHTHATLMLAAGIHPKIVSERLGHASIGITLDTYSHVLPGLQEAAAERFDRMLEGIGSKADDGPDVSKMLAGDTPSKSEPGGIRTRDALIKSQVLFL
jgi:integrase